MAKKRIKRRKTDDNNYPVIRKYKILIFILIVLFTIGLLYFVYNKKSVYKCSKIVDQSSSGYKIKTTYDIYSERNKVNYIEITNNIYSDDINLLKQMKIDFNKNYEEQNNRFKGYTISVDEERGRTIVRVKIDYSKVDMNELKKEYNFIEKYIEDGTITVEGAKRIYSSEGAKCE